MKRILVGIDGSMQSKAALEFAAGLARVSGAELELACSVEVPMQYGPDEAGAAAVASILADGFVLAAQRGVSSRTMAVEGPAADALAALAKSREADLVVVGHRSRNALARMVLGSVAERLVQICPRPVLVYR